MKFLRLLSLFLFTFLGTAFAGKPVPWQTSFQEPASPLAREIIETHDYIMLFMFAVVFVVLCLLTFIIVRFRASKNRVPSTVSHNTLLEIIWITIPILIVIAIAIPSVKLVFKQEKIPTSEMTIKAIGKQWYWSYEYPDHGNLAFDSYMVKEEDQKPGDLRLLEVDNEIVLPIETNITIQVTSADVIHSFAIPALGLKTDGIPGRLNETWTYIEKAGIYYGQCSELCGPYHAFMPIRIRAVSKEEFKEWIEKAKLEFAQNSLESVNFAMLN